MIEYCVHCHEPWEAGEVRRYEAMRREEADLFLEGRGCPCCSFGTTTHRAQAYDILAVTSAILQEQAHQDYLEETLLEDNEEEDNYEYYEGESNLVWTFLETPVAA